MPKPFDFGDVHLTAGGDSVVARPDPETPFCIAILGDFSGRSNRKLSSGETILKRRPVLIDRDNFDEVLAKLGVEIDLPIGEGGFSRLRFSELDDFHPDRVFEHLDAFRKLRDLRARLEDPSTFKETADELGLRSSAPALLKKSADTVPPAPPSVSRLASANLLDEMIEQTESRAGEDRPRRSSDEVLEFARRVAEPHLVSAPDPNQAEVLAVIDRAIGTLMRAVLHNADFQALEAAWRAVYLLVRRLETSSDLKVYLIDVSKEELASDLGSTEDPLQSSLGRLIVERSVEADAGPWAVIAGNYSFGPGTSDVKLLSQIARIAQRAGAPFVAEASPELPGCTSFECDPDNKKALQVPAGGWAQLRHLPVAGRAGLALPRFLLRLPYGKKTSPVESINFEEFPSTPRHEDYLWGNPAFVVALLLGQSFSESGWDLHPGEISEIDGLPLHVYDREGNSEMKPCAETLLTEEEIDLLLDAGFMPLVSFRGSDKVRLARFQSIADPLRALVAKWMR